MNAGHEPFLLRRNGEWQWITPDPGFILAGLPGFEYTCASLQMQPGDRIYTYTDGVPEAHDKNDELFGEERLMESIRKHGGEPFTELLPHIRADIEAYADGVPQFDDITMMIFEYRG